MSPETHASLLEKTPQHSVEKSHRSGTSPGTLEFHVQRHHWLASNVYVAVTHESAIFLDLRRDRYFGLNGLSSQLLAEILNDFPVPTGIATPTQQRTEIIQSLLKDNLIATSRPNDTIHSVVPRHHSGLLAAEQSGCLGRTVVARDLLNFLTACAHANVQLRFQPLEAIVRGVAARKRQATRRGLSHTVETAATLTSVFRVLRPLAFSADGRCLFHALALVHFLARYSAFPTWVIGVRSTPFAAHSWVQDGDVILDATPEHIAPYIPILGI